LDVGSFFLLFIPRAHVVLEITTFLSAGHETTSATITWALYALAKYTNVQVKLRDEMQSARLGDVPSMDQLDSLGYLNNFVREVLRIYAVVPMSGREVAHDTVIPVGESFTDLTGTVQTGIRSVFLLAVRFFTPLIRHQCTKGRFRRYSHNIYQ
jgi:hypothetical protein